MLKWKNVKVSNKAPPSWAKSWIDFWEQKSDTKAKKCSVLGCGADATEGAQVKKVKLRSNQDQDWYIIPVCHKCNENETKEFELKSGVKPIKMTDKEKPNKK
ncbi:MAG: hypothetical protein FWC33_03235 [Candidatus Bathyarchaeota archaeon]|nr:hypothetical protein [Candidatus Termiticorpusculum sp.]